MKAQYTSVPPWSVIAEIQYLNKMLRRIKVIFGIRIAKKNQDIIKDRIKQLEVHL